MGRYPRLIADLTKIEHNTRVISTLAAEKNINLMGVSKCCCGEPQVAEAMLKGGVVSIGDSRIENLKRLKEAGLGVDLIMLRLPMLSEAGEVVKYSDISLNSEIVVISRLSDEALKNGRKHGILLMVEMGDLREGIRPDDLERAVEQTLACKGVELSGLGMNLACFGGVVPTEEKIEEFLSLALTIEKKFGIELKIVSEGNSANLPLLPGSKKRKRVNNLRIGEGIIVGVDAVRRDPVPGTFQDAFIVEAELIELKDKPSVPRGEISQNAFGEKPVFEDKGIVTRGILALGRQDVVIGGLKPLDPSISILGASSDHTIVRVDAPDKKIGDILSFQVNYVALLQLHTSAYIRKEYVSGPSL
ncbi:MAG: alanine/ornithine racemase family PLP-dependent enzyme [Deltaproteobacteria bacterium]|nr:alanine/ornithine racemase family PLP-dependent enzyme [Deltaproteobacteria bacterium]